MTLDSRGILIQILRPISDPDLKLCLLRIHVLKNWMSESLRKAKSNLGSIHNSKLTDPEHRPWKSNLCLVFFPFLFLPARNTEQQYALKFYFELGFIHTVCPGSSDPPEKIFNIFASENEVYTIY